MVRHLHGARLEADRRGGELPGGAGRILALQRLVVERLPRIGAQRIPVLRRNAADEAIAVPARRAVQREHAAGLRIDRHRATLQRVAEDAGDEALEIHVDVRVQIGSRHRRQILASARVLHDAAARVHFDELAAFLAAQDRLVLLLEPLLAHLLPRLVVLERRLRQFLFAHFARVAHERCDDRTVGIEAARRTLCCCC